MTSLNQIVDRLRVLSLSHKQLNSFYFGDPHEFTFNGEIEYGACFLELLPGSTSRSTKFKNFSFRAYFLDRVGVSEDTEENETEVLSDRCQVHADDVTFETDFDMARTKIIPYTGGGSETSTITVSGLAGKIVLAVYRAGDYKRIITTVPTDSDKVKVTGTDLGSYKGILSTDGTIVLQAGDALVSGEVLDVLVWSN